MTATPLIEQLTAAGCSVVLIGDKVKVRGPREALSAEADANLRKHKEELVVTLSDPYALLKRAGDLAKEINFHLTQGCDLCRREHFTTDEVVPLCSYGRALKTEYRKSLTRASANQQKGLDRNSQLVMIKMPKFSKAIEET